MGFCINFSLGHNQHKVAPFKAVKAKCILLWNKVIKIQLRKQWIVHIYANEIAFEVK